MKPACMYSLLILCCVGCKNTPAAVPGQSVEFPNAVITISGVGSDARPYSMPAAGPGVIEGAMTASVGNEKWALWWTYKGTADIGDIYEFIIVPGWKGTTLSSHTKPAPTEPQIVHALAYSGTAAILYVEEKGKITISPVKP